MNGHESTERLELIEQAFTTLASCARQIRERRVDLDEGGGTWALGSIGGRLLLAAQYGAQSELRLLQHWVNDAAEICGGLISKAEVSYERRITAGDVMSAFRKAPPPDFL